MNMLIRLIGKLSEWQQLIGNARMKIVINVGEARHALNGVTAAVKIAARASRRAHRITEGMANREGSGVDQVYVDAADGGSDSLNTRANQRALSMKPQFAQGRVDAGTHEEIAADHERLADQVGDHTVAMAHRAAAKAHREAHTIQHDVMEEFPEEYEREFGREVSG